MPARKYGPSTPAVDHTVRALAEVGGDLSGQSHDHVAFVDLELTEVPTTGAVLDSCTFRGVRFNASGYSDTAFINCVFVRCSFFDTSFDACKFTGSLFDGCTHDLMKVGGGDWSFVGLPRAKLSRASFVGVRMREADLTGSRCDGATLRDNDLSGALWDGADLSGADLRGSDLSALDPLAVTLRGARIDPWQAIVVATALGLAVD
ncbi:pentapeptide repeat-containing protein [Frankia sp. QA3]|uniref:pentapeptide repeat-containing protein n=1 Tax=Frankia sp. QA3 TaxID=710111 RepID=UPI000269C7E2|nr:pentapeptide repeat-containing protein [Frankia sp. QA3]EIV93651.1 putative low-complexity protein [Frankia sp. QA3]